MGPDKLHYFIQNCVACATINTTTFFLTDILRIIRQNTKRYFGQEGAKNEGASWSVENKDVIDRKEGPIFGLAKPKKAVLVRKVVKDYHDKPLECASYAHC